MVHKEGPLPSYNRAQHSQSHVVPELRVSGEEWVYLPRTAADRNPGILYQRRHIVAPKEALRHVVSILV